MLAGQLRHRITVQRLTVGRDLETGNRVESWEDHCTVWSSVSDLSTKDQIADRAMQGTMRGRAVVRYNTLTAAIDTTMRVLFDGVYYKIDGNPSRNLGDRRTFLTINLAEGLSEWQ